MMKMRYLPLLAALIVGCAHGALMTIDDFSNIQVGTSIQEVEKKYGKPIQTKKEGNRIVYEYVERIKMGTDTVEMRKYFFVVRDGKIVNKYVRYKNPPAYDEVYSDDMFPDQGG
ncbi:MAG: hypothetical protein K9M07_04950 [Simkaniaceae bacterium]|nr:hypothetical protein [Simkaniaceae bacterium]MCF7852569.1 hypothetical protein [Simkaniaceae bacterium]